MTEQECQKGQQEYLETEANIRSAFLSLLKDVPYQKIRVQELAQKAGISRQTFYHYYSSKEVLLISLLDEVFDHLYEQVMPIEPGKDNGRRVLKALFATCETHYDLLHVVMNAGVDDKAYERMRSYATRIAGNLARNHNLELDNISYLKYFIEKVAGSFFHIIRLWLSEEQPVSSDEMVEVFYKTIQIERLFFFPDT